MVYSALAISPHANPRETDKQTTDRQREAIRPHTNPRETDRQRPYAHIQTQERQATDRRQTDRQREAISPQTNPKNRQTDDRQTDRQTDRQRPYVHIQTQKRRTNRQTTDGQREAIRPHTNPRETDWQTDRQRSLALCSLGWDWTALVVQLARSGGLYSKQLKLWTHLQHVKCSRVLTPWY